jgi:hypothetical protein
MEELLLTVSIVRRGARLQKPLSGLAASADVPFARVIMVTAARPGRFDVRFGGGGGRA